MGNGVASDGRHVILRQMTKAERSEYDAGWQAGFAGRSAGQIAEHLRYSCE
jgi:hypothetical protein